MAHPYHEEKLSDKVRDMHRALNSLQEELEAVDWYNQRAEAATDADLKAILLHNRDEEIEHAVMLFEHLRRVEPAFEEEMKTYLFKTAPVTEIEEAGDGGGAPDVPDDGSLHIGRL